MNKNAEQTSTRGSILVGFRLIFSLGYFTSDLTKTGSAFLMMHYGKVRGTQTRGNI